MRTPECLSVAARLVLCFVFAVWGVSSCGSPLPAGPFTPRSAGVDPVVQVDLTGTDQSSASTGGADASPVGDAKTTAAKGIAKNAVGSDKTPPAPAAAHADAGGKPVDLSIDINGYVVGEQDLLAITVWKEKELSSSVVVRPDGKITVPLVGDVKVAGMTTLQVQALLAEKLKPFVTVPQVTVAVTQINSRKVYLIGQVVKEGTFPLNGSATVLQILTEAGGLKDFAKRKSIYILRQSGGKQVRYSFNYDAVIRGKKQEENIQLQPGDTIVVP